MTTFLSLGFRPLFLLAGLSAPTLVVAWVASLLLGGPLDLRWHGHELVFGFMGAVIGGFFLTATPRWTDTRPVTGAALAGVVALWLAARAVLVAPIPPEVQVAVALGYPLALTAITTWAIAKARSTRNALFPILLAVWTAADAAVLLNLSADALRIAVYALLGIIAVFGGRITPLFTRNALRGVAELRPRDRRDDLAIASVLVLLPAQALTPLEPALPALFALAALATAVRMLGWATWATRREPLLWVLQLGHASLSVGLALEAFAHLQPTVLAPRVSLHAITVGVLGAFALGMMTRVLRGHTARPLKAGPVLAVAYALIPLAAAVRVLGPALNPSWAPLSWLVSGVLWAGAFAVFVAWDGLKLLRPRIDGKPG